MTEQNEYSKITLRRKIPNPPGKRKEWDQITVEKKMLFELRRIADIVDLVGEKFGIVKKVNPLDTKSK